MSSRRRNTISCNPSLLWWQGRIQIKLHLTGKSRLTLKFYNTLIYHRCWTGRMNHRESQGFQTYLNYLKREIPFHPNSKASRVSLTDAILTRESTKIASSTRRRYVCLVLFFPPKGVALDPDSGAVVVSWLMSLMYLRWRSCTRVRALMWHRGNRVEQQKNEEKRAEIFLTSLFKMPYKTLLVVQFLHLKWILNILSVWLNKQ